MWETSFLDPPIDINQNMNWILIFRNCHRFEEPEDIPCVLSLEQLWGLFIAAARPISKVTPFFLYFEHEEWYFTTQENWAGINSSRWGQAQNKTLHLQTESLEEPKNFQEPTKCSGERKQSRVRGGLVQKGWVRKSTLRQLKTDGAQIEGRLSRSFGDYISTSLIFTRTMRKCFGTKLLRRFQTIWNLCQKKAQLPRKYFEI